MKRLLALAALVAASCSLHAQVVETTVCDILKNPASFNGKTVRVKGTVVAGFEQFVIEGKDCSQPVNAIWLAYPEGTRAKAGPAVMLHLQPASNFTGKVNEQKYQPVTLVKDKAFKEFDSHLASAHKTNALCLGCNRYTVSATLVGRLDGVADAGYIRNEAGKIVAISGFGNLNAYRARLVLQSVSDVAAQDVSYSKSDAAIKGELSAPTAAGNPTAGLEVAARAYGPGNPLGGQLQRAADAFAKPGEQNGVVVDFDKAGEAHPGEDDRGTQSSPDGVLYNCVFDNDRLKNNAMSAALAFAGTEVADLRSPNEATSGKDPYTIGFHAWQIAVVGTIGMRGKTLTLPGDYLAWNMGWPAAQRDSMMQGAIADYLSNQVLIRH
ncbi:MAG TPA: hypothetical protein VFI20_01440 [Terracidiphilus sp.]|nr:hypothetical protein [Terracidiphilus sp.]